MRELFDSVSLFVDFQLVQDLQECRPHGLWPSISFGDWTVARRRCTTHSPLLKLSLTSQSHMVKGNYVCGSLIQMYVLCKSSDLLIKVCCPDMMRPLTLPCIDETRRLRIGLPDLQTARAQLPLHRRSRRQIYAIPLVMKMLQTRYALSPAVDDIT